MKNEKIHSTSMDEKIQNGVFFTPPILVDLIVQLLSSYDLSNSVIGDFGAGHGAFLPPLRNKGKRIFATETDSTSCDFLREHFPQIELFEENSLLNVSPEKYGLSPKESLVAVGNPPYNDITSQYKKGEKGVHFCDDDLCARDLGISFLKAYDKLKADIVCVLHPLAYLIKKQNFLSLGTFIQHYQLVDGIIFSSKEFDSVSQKSAQFPVVATLYERNLSGTNFPEVLKFPFKVLNSDKPFVLNQLPTIDGKISKYPKQGHHSGLQFYTLRDMNALLRNASFVEGEISNGVEIPFEDLPKYAWLLFLKDHFQPPRFSFLYGNLSPLWTKKLNQKEFQAACISYAFRKHPLVKKYYSEKVLTEKFGPILPQDSLLLSELKALYF